MPTIISSLSDRSKARMLFFAYVLFVLFTDNDFFFLAFNLFLAFAALELSYLLPLFRARLIREWPASIAVYSIFVLMSPNVFYMVTDLIHMNLFDFDYLDEMAMEEWWHFFLLAAGVFIALFFYVLMVQSVQRLLGAGRWSRMLLLLFVLLGSIGIYIGRFLRFHSVHLFTEPWLLLERLLQSFSKDAFLFVSWITLLQLLAIAVFGRGTGRGTPHE